jgi:1-acyl-sn-glycerol-3-phosphate acyltransferase
LPQAGLLASNHLTYLDIITIGSLMPTVFVSKAEVKNWPVFGWCAQRGGTLFIDRTRRADVSRISAEIRDVLDTGQVVVLFPEGTSSNGHEVLPFKSSLLEPVCASEHPLCVAHISYELDQGSVENDVCYWGGMTFFPHMLRLMALKNIRAHIRFAPIVNRASDRKELARQLHAEIVRLKTTAHADKP